MLGWGRGQQHANHLLAVFGPVRSGVASQQAAVAPFQGGGIQGSGFAHAAAPAPGSIGARFLRLDCQIARATSAAIVMVGR